MKLNGRCYEIHIKSRIVYPTLFLTKVVKNGDKNHFSIRIGEQPVSVDRFAILLSDCRV